MSEFDEGNAFAENESLKALSMRDIRKGNSLILRMEGPPKLVQSSDMKGKPKFWKNDDGTNGKPIMDFVFPVTVLEGSDTWTKDAASGDESEANPVGEKRACWLKRGKTQSGGALLAVSTEVAQQRGYHLTRGDVFRMTLSGFEKPKPGESPKKIYTFEFLRREEARTESVFDEPDAE